MEKSSKPRRKRATKEEEKIAVINNADAGIAITEDKLEEANVVKVVVPEGWTPKTELGKAVAAGKVTNLDEIFEKGLKITEPYIVDMLIPNLMNEIVLIGGSGGKGGGSKRIPSRRTARMHKSGRRFKASAMVIVGNGNGYVGIGMAAGPAGKHREVISKAMNAAKLNLIPIRRGCGSWECNCSGPHSIPSKIHGRCASVHIDLIPAPKGIGLCVMDDMKKFMRIAGIKDIWCKSRGQTSTRFNTIKACFDAMKKQGRFRTRDDYDKATGMRAGRVD